MAPDLAFWKTYKNPACKILGGFFRRVLLECLSVSCENVDVRHAVENLIISY